MHLCSNIQHPNTTLSLPNTAHITKFEGIVLLDTSFIRREDCTQCKKRHSFCIVTVWDCSTVLWYSKLSKFVDQRAATWVEHTTERRLLVNAGSLIKIEMIFSYLCASLFHIKRRSGRCWCWGVWGGEVGGSSPGRSCSWTPATWCCSSDLWEPISRTILLKIFVQIEKINHRYTLICCFGQGK